MKCCPDYILNWVSLQSFGGISDPKFTLFAADVNRAAVSHSSNPMNAMIYNPANGPPSTVTFSHPGYVSIATLQFLECSLQVQFFKLHLHGVQFTGGKELSK